MDVPMAAEVISIEDYRDRRFLGVVAMRRLEQAVGRPDVVVQRRPGHGPTVERGSR